jgi:two-component system cell cycle response regulator DivK
MSTNTNSFPTIIIADSHEDERCLLKSILELKGFSVLEAGDGLQAFDLALQWHPDLILIDLKLPVVSGFTVIRRMQKLARLRLTPIIAMSVDKPISHERLALAAGCAAHLNKPIEFDELDSLIERLLPVSLTGLASALVH